MTVESPADVVNALTTTGHGHVVPRRDGRLARCGGPPICPACAQDQARLAAANGFFEEDEDIEKIRSQFESGEKFMTEPPPYTAADVESVAKAEFDAIRLRVDPDWSDISEDDRDSYRKTARAMLDELDRRGRLAPSLQEDNARCRDAHRLARILTDLDRCEHGRHRIDHCFDCGGPSMGNPHLTPGRVVGYDREGKPYVVPSAERPGPLCSTGNPDAWRPQPVEEV